MIYFIADTHFGDSAIIRYENRPFASADKMEQEIISRWNNTVTDEDSVYILGDFGASGREGEILSLLRGKKYLVKGNHDTASNEYYRAAGFAEVYDLPVLFENFWLLSHKPIYVCENMPYANIFGHVHASPLYKDFSSHHFCVSAERIDYTPISFESIKRSIQDAK